MDPLVVGKVLSNDGINDALFRPIDAVVENVPL